MAKKQQLEELLEQALVKDKDKPYEVPENWVWTRFKFLADRLQYGYTESASYDEVGPRFLRITDIQDNNIDWINVPYCTIIEKDFEKYKVNNGDIVVARTGATTGKSYLVSNPPIAVFASYLIRISTVSNVVPSYIWLFMNSSYYWNQITENKKGSAQPGVNAQKLGELIIPISPLPEQQRIVDFIESLFEKLDRAKELAQNALDSFENRKSAILHKAFTGELTAKWRAANISNIEHTAISILETIKEYRERELKRSKKPDSITESEILFALPDGWMWCCLGDIQEVSGGIQKTPKRKPDKNPTPYLAVANVKRGYLDLAQVKEFEVSSQEISKFLLKYNDILIIEGNGSASEIGRCAIWKDEITPCVHQNHIIRTRNYLNLILPEYILSYLNSSIGMELMKSKAKTTAGLYNLSTGKIKEILVPIPSLEEQKEIVRILDNLLENEQKAKELCDVIDKIDHMKKAILARAFRGELSTNNPDEESALELLKEVLKKKV
jgi:type I restriction enzyme, S subunit